MCLVMVETLSSRSSRGPGCSDGGAVFMAANAALLLSLCVLTSNAPCEPPARGPFDSASSVPDSVHLYVHVERARDLRAWLTTFPVAGPLESLIGESAIGLSWHALADGARVEDGLLFDTMFGQSFTLISRVPVADGPNEWAVVTALEPEWWRNVEPRLRLRRMRPYHGVAMLESPEQGLLLARIGGNLLLGPRDQSGLLLETIRLMTDGGASLQDHPAVMEAVGLGRGHIGVLSRTPGADSWTAAVISGSQGGSWRVSHLSRVSDPVFTPTNPRRELQLDFWRWFDPVVRLAITQPIPEARGMWLNFLASFVPEVAHDASLRAALGERMGVMLIELDRPPAPDEHGSAIVMLVEVRAAETAEATLDKTVTRVLEGWNREFGDELGRVTLPDLESVAAGKPRESDIGLLAEAFFPELPASERARLHWTTVHSPSGTWWVLSTGRPQLMQIANLLDTTSDETLRRGGAMAQQGRARLRLARWQVAMIGEILQARAPEQDRPAVARTVNLLKDVADHVDKVDWQAHFPDPRRIRTDWQIRLHESPSAGGGDDECQR